jgi:pimeloyl-ACP methyl ester carboxylesterase
VADAQKIPRVELQLMGNAGHALFVDKPEEFNHLVEDFLRRN